MSERGKKWEEFETTTIPAYIDRIKDAKKQLKKSKDVLYNTIKELGDRIKEFLPEDATAASLKHYLDGVVSSKTIERALKPEDKQKKKVPEKSTDELATLSQVDDKKTIEVSAGTNMQSVSTEPQNQNTNQNTNTNNDELIDVPDERPPTITGTNVTTQTNQETEILKSKLRNTDTELIQRLKEIKDQESKIFNLEQQIKSMMERKQQQPTEEQQPKKDFAYDSSSEYVLAKEEFDHTIIVQGGLNGLDNFARMVRDIIIKYPKLDHLLIQQNVNNRSKVRLNLKKPNFIT